MNTLLKAPWHGLPEGSDILISNTAPSAILRKTRTSSPVACAFASGLQTQLHNTFLNNRIMCFMTLINLASRVRPPVFMNMSHHRWTRPHFLAIPEAVISASTSTFEWFLQRSP